MSQELYRLQAFLERPFINTNQNIVMSTIAVWVVCSKILKINRKNDTLLVTKVLIMMIMEDKDEVYKLWR